MAKDRRLHFKKSIADSKKAYCEEFGVEINENPAA